MNRNKNKTEMETSKGAGINQNARQIEEKSLNTEVLT